MSQSIDVAIRIRPLLETEKKKNLKNSRLRTDIDRNEVRLLSEDRQNTKIFKFDKVCDEASDQQAFYKTVGIENYVDKVMEGYHATIFCYGQTGAGKTYTMEGFEYETPNGNKQSSIHQKNKIKASKDEGIIPRAIKDIYKKVDSLSKKYDRTYTVCCSFLEIYNEKIYDLLNPDQVSRMENNGPGLKLRWNKREQFVVENLYVFTCNNAEEAQFLFQIGMRNKTMASHRLNNASSRSHAIFEIKIEYYNNSNPEDIITSKLELVDLAGSERVSLVSNDGKVTKETIDINKSLFTLRQVINVISENQNKSGTSHIPYRDSKLTALLKQSIGGNAYCLMIACLAPSDESIEENISTLTYATKVTKIQNEPTRNEDPRIRMIQSLKVENKELLDKLNEANDRIYQLTNKIRTRVGSDAKENGFEDESHAHKKGYERKPSEQEAAVLAELENNMNLRQSYSETPFDLVQGDNKYLTEELVEAINQIRYLLGSLKQEREKNEFLSIQNEKQENTISQLMRENQEFRDRIEFIEGARTPDRRSRSPISVPQTRGGTSGTPYLEEAHNYRRAERENMLLYTTMSTLHPDHEPLKGLVSPLDGPDKFMNASMNGQFSSIVSSGMGQTPNGEMESHFRTTTNFARNTMYRKFNGTNTNFNGTNTNFPQLVPDMNDDRSSSEDKGLRNPTPDQSVHARNRSEMAGFDDGYNASNLIRMQKKEDRINFRSSVDRVKAKPPTSSSTQGTRPKLANNSKILLLKDVTQTINPVIQYPKSQGKSKGLNNSFVQQRLRV